MASSMLNIIQQVGGSIGISVLSTVLSHRVPYHIAVISSGMDRTSPAFTESFRNMVYHIHSQGYTYVQSSQIAQSALFRKVVKCATVQAFQDAFIFGSILVILAFIFALFLPGRASVSFSDEKVEAEIIEEMVCID
jgi:DHA2 family multidrug resistance protein